MILFYFKPLLTFYFPDNAARLNPVSLFEVNVLVGLVQDLQAGLEKPYLPGS